MIYTTEMEQFLKDNIKGTPYKKITEMFNEKYGTSLSWYTIKAELKRLNLRNGIDARFTKGHVPMNKGQKMPPEIYAKAYPTMFKKGQESINKRPLYSERITKDGYVEIKTEEPNTWKLKHKWIWEQKNGKIPDGMCLLFRDRNKQNCDIENLVLIYRKELVIINKNKLSSDDPAITDTGIAVARLMSKTYERRNKK